MDLDGLMGLAEGFLSHIVKRVLETHRAELKVIGKDVAKLEAVVAAGAFPRLSYDEAHAMLLEAHAKGLIESEHVYGDDFGSPDETYISNQFDKPVMVHRYPAAVKAFYMQPDPSDPSKALCVDVLAPEGYGESMGCRWMRSSGIWIYANMGVCRTPGLGWGLSAAWPGSAGWSM
jgi:asparaginyl-tRNA synthetase